ncbi:FHA domain-containing protein [Leptolyngbya sp. 7M]|uniref:FHA domain-containing protein n=1 Tax=Leptolyngbya sp. 7M TaxID=2812896 RepID=UPI001B8D6C96|nr:FHA domain-containing protein [Leptolyngbya sp. 7M]QYO67282.1 FHA domain-containing protein [Leptolyngbya sp. 7M]
MAQLCLKFHNEVGDEQQVNIDRDRFVIGRHSDCDLCIRDSRLSRQHCVIEKRNDSHFLTDLGSANGTLLNGEDILVETEIRDGDTLDLGGVVIELGSAEVENEEVLKEDLPESASAEQEHGSQSPPASAAQPQGKAKKKGIPTGVLLMLSMFAIVILLFAGVIIYLAASRSGKVQPKLVTIEDRDPDIEDTDDKPTDANLPKGPGTQQTAPTTTGPVVDDPSQVSLKA